MNLSPYDNQSTLILHTMSITAAISAFAITILTIGIGAVIAFAVTKDGQAIITGAVKVAKVDMSSVNVKQMCDYLKYQLGDNRSYPIAIRSYNTKERFMMTKQEAIAVNEYIQSTFDNLTIETFRSDVATELDDLVDEQREHGDEGMWSFVIKC